jgi:mannose-1-phosphate guanylyltransferase
MNQSTLYTVIMAGGTGTRFWPISRELQPKQFHDVLGTGRTLLQQTADRLKGLCDAEHILVVTGNHYKDIVHQQLPELPTENVLTESERRHAAPAIAYACAVITKRDPNATVVILPADHLILDPAEFQATLKKACEAAKAADTVVTIGVRPSRPDTDYGYIQYEQNEDAVAKKVLKFTKKPPLVLAESFLASGDFLWNAGIFVFTIPTIQGIFAHFISETYTLSFDYSIMEKAKNVMVIAGNFGWSDLGTWKTLHDVRDKDSVGNVVDGLSVMRQTSGCIIKVEADKLVVTYGLHDYIVAEEGNVLLICPRDREQEVRALAAEAKKMGKQYA